MRYRIRVCLYAALTAGFLAGGAAHADGKLYKWVDENGNVSYQDEPPPDAGGQVETLSEDIGGAQPEQSATMPDVDVVLYSIKACDACDLVRELLNSRGIPFTEKNADNNAEVQAEIKKVSGVLSVPVLTIGDQALTGFNRELIINELGEAGFPTTETASASGQSGQQQGNAPLTREDLQNMTPEERQQAAQDAALRGEDNDLFDEDEGFTLNDDIFSDSDNGETAADNNQYEVIPEDERIRVNQ